MDVYCHFREEILRKQKAEPGEADFRPGVTSRKQNVLEPGIGSKCFLKRDKFPFVREDICKIYYLGSCELAPDLKHTGIGQMAMTSQ